jgi:hypothetical protein
VYVGTAVCGCVRVGCMLVLLFVVVNMWVYVGTAVCGCVRVGVCWYCCVRLCNCGCMLVLLSVVESADRWKHMDYCRL